MYFNTWQFSRFYSIPYRNAVMSICTGIEDDKIIFPAGLMDFIYDFPPSWLVWIKSASMPSRCASSMTAAAISARVTVPYTSGSREPIKFRLGPFITMIFSAYRYISPLSLRYPIHRDPDTGSEMPGSSFHQHRSLRYGRHHIHLELLSERVYF